LLVKDIATANYPALYEDELVTKARAIIRKQGLGILPVINQQKHLLGVISRRAIMTISSSKSAIRVKGIMNEPDIILTKDAEVSQAAREMLRLDAWYAPVTNSAQDNVYAGVLGLENFLNVFLKAKSSKLMKPVYEVMTTDIATCTPDDEIDNIWRQMQEKHLHALFVMKEKKLIGIVTERDLLESGAAFPAFESKKGRFKSPAKVFSVMHMPVTTLKEATSLREAARLMLEKNFGRLPVVDEKGTLLGIVDRKDVVKGLL
jgi:CBS domain-containing protein